MFLGRHYLITDWSYFHFFQYYISWQSTIDIVLYYCIEAGELLRFSSKIKTVIWPSEIKTHQLHHNRKYHWVSDNEKQVPFLKSLITLNKRCKIYVINSIATLAIWILKKIACNRTMTAIHSCANSNSWITNSFGYLWFIFYIRYEKVAKQ